MMPHPPAHATNPSLSLSARAIGPPEQLAIGRELNSYTGINWRLSAPALSQARGHMDRTAVCYR
jgi:hypothetical protein